MLCITYRTASRPRLSKNWRRPTHTFGRADKEQIKGYTISKMNKCFQIYIYIERERENGIIRVQFNTDCKSQLARFGLLQRRVRRGILWRAVDNTKL